MQKSKNDNMVEILRRLKPEMHGAVVESMVSRGVRYGLNYGVAVPVIRRVAKEYAPDHELAAYLFRQDIRELKLAAIYVDDPGQVTAEQMNRWADGMPADEVMEHAAMHLFYASPDAGDIIREWLTGSDRSRQKGAFHMIGKQAGQGMLGETEAEKYLLEIERCFSVPHPPLSALIYALLRVADVSETMKNRVRGLAEGLRISPDSSLREIGEEIEAFLAG